MKKQLILSLIILLFFIGENYASYYKLSSLNTGGRVLKVELIDTLLYSFKYGGTFEIIDVGNLETPTLISSFLLPDFQSGGRDNFAIIDSIALISSQNAIHILNIKDPENPVYIGEFEIAMPYDILISDQQAYIATSSGLQIFDLSNPYYPEFVGSISGQLNGICKKDSLIYGVHPSSPNNLRIINVADPSNPELLSDFDLPIYSNADIDISDTVVFIAYDRSLWSISVNNPNNPIMLDTLHVNNHSDCISIFDNKAFVNLSTSGFMVVDISDPTKLSKEGFFDTPSVCSYIIVDANVAFVDDYFSGIQIVNIENEQNEYLIGSSLLGNCALGIEFNQNHLFVADDSGLSILDVENAQQPMLIGSYLDGIGMAKNISISNNILCLGRGYDRPSLSIVDISEVEYPELLHYLQPNTGSDYVPVSILQNESLLFAGMGDDLEIYDLEQINELELLGAYSAKSSIVDIERVDNLVYLALSDSSLEIVNIENLSQPELMAGYKSSDYIYKIMFHDDLLLLSNENDGINVIDVSDPYTPMFVYSIKPHIDSEIYTKPIFHNDKLWIFDHQWNELSVYEYNNSGFTLLNSTRLNTDIYDMKFVDDQLYCSNLYHGISILDVSNIAAINIPDESKINVLKAYPNPFSVETNIEYKVDNKCFVKVNVYNENGKLIKILENSMKENGMHSINWRGIDSNNSPVKSGIYFVILIAGNKEHSCKVILINDSY